MLNLFLSNLSILAASTQFFTPFSSQKYLFPSFSRSLWALANY
nr:MAG TPA: hypothetical protein [Caudoviricetes sp.]